MLATAQPVAPLHEHYFNSTNARKMAALGIKARRDRKANLEAEAIRARSVLAQERPDISRELARVLKRLDQLNRAMDADDLDPKQWDMLTRAYDRVFKAWMVLSGTPGSGQRKPAPLRQGRPSYPQPEVVPEPAPTVPVPEPGMFRPNAGVGTAPVPVAAPAPSPTVAVNAPAPPEPTGLTPG